jgi:two-component system CheB/CheR fusion protein
MDEAMRESLEREHAARAEAEHANHLKDEFLASISHELRNPLNVIVGYTEVLLRAPNTKSVPLIREAAEAIGRNAAAQAQLVNDLLDLSRLQIGKLAVERRPINLGPIVGDAVASIQAQAEGKEIKLISDYPADPLMVNADPVRIQQIVWNLVNNAMKFTSRDGRVSVRLSREADKAKLEVEDTGQGIAPEFLPHIFEMFRQANGRITRAHGGLGIGLALVKQLVDLHGGQIQAHSEGAGRGAHFTVWLPLHTTTPERPTEVTKSIEGEIQGARILVVDDNHDTLDALRALLEGEGAVVETAVSGADALKKAKAAQMDLVISDIAMPEMDGYELLKELRGQSNYTNVPAIALTGFGREEDVERARQAGFDTHLTKPLNFEHLVSLVRNTLRQ